MRTSVGLSPWRGPRAYAIWGALVSVVFIVASVLGGPLGQLRAWLPVTVSGSVVVAIVVGIRRFRPSPAWPWVVLAIGRAAYAVGDYVSYARATSGEALPFPSVADALYLAHYPLLIVAVVGLMRSRWHRRDRTAIVDASIVAVMFALLVWLLVLRPYAILPGPMFGRVVGMLYPVFDVAALTVAVGLMLGTGARTVTMRLLSCSIAGLFVVDVIYNVLLLDGSFVAGSAFDAAWLVLYVLLGAAALHPSMALRDDVDGTQAVRSLRVRLAVLGAAMLFGPTMAVLVDGQDVAIAVGSAVISLLVVVRFAGLLRNEATAHTERAQLVSEVLQAGERERTELAVELHDGPIQRLAGLGLVLDAVEMTLDDSAVSARRQVTRARDGVLDEIRDLRRLMANLRPPALDHGGLAGAVQDHVHAAMAASAAPIALQVSMGGAIIDPDVETVLYRVMQEGLANARRHAHAGRIDVRLWAEDDAVHVLVADDGVGIDMSRAEGEREHFGLAAMRERTERVGGTCRVRTGSRGTTVHTSVPRRPAARLATSGTRPARTHGRKAT